MRQRADIYPADRLILREVALRDGLQLVKSWPDTNAKRLWLQQEHAAGIRHFEVGSFLPPQRFPQFADVRDVAQTVHELPGAHSIALVLNERGLHDALSAGVGEIALVVSATEAHSQANQNRSRAQALDLVKRAVTLRDNAGGKPLVSVGIAMAFGCSLSGPVAAREVTDLVSRALTAGADLIALADTVGYGGPDAVGALTQTVISMCGDIPVCVHLHDTRGMAIANAAAALDVGCRILDGSLGGLGGCPFAPGATGNAVIEDLVFLSEAKGLPTDIDLKRLIAVRDVAQRAMPNEPLFGALARAGPIPVQGQPATMHHS